MLIVGITGGIGSGKSIVGKIVEAMGYPVYPADDRAKEILRENSAVREQIIDLLGPESYNGETPDRKYIASKVFGDDQLLSKLNHIVHPAVGNDFKEWESRQTTDLVFKEAAIMIESGTYKDVDRVILVSCPDPIRIERVVQRDGVTEEEVRKRMKAQMTDVEKLPFAHFQIMNDGQEMVIPQVLDILKKLKA